MKMGSDLTGIWSDLVGMLTVVEAIPLYLSWVADALESGGDAKGGGGQPPLYHDPVSQTRFLSHVEATRNLKPLIKSFSNFMNQDEATKYLMNNFFC
ncbi:hypothetical protein HanHA300_Chr14g0524431 [Helianthus annuus]|nr:hypothetical protein HanHA300_Chr14g0524431 [Helianthus annuus]KAJ0468645.1 hypothetical protein HanIR_Chr14g0698941 [Helianthus annuus]KAJ0840407.1 hypothetical protein HanPSC8_Chr14g0618311 [Helianthus annuus]